MDAESHVAHPMSRCPAASMITVARAISRVVHVHQLKPTTALLLLSHVHVHASSLLVTSLVTAGRKDCALSVVILLPAHKPSRVMV